jgi:hypothetical protein
VILIYSEINPCIRLAANNYCSEFFILTHMQFHRLNMDSRRFLVIFSFGDVTVSSIRNFFSCLQNMEHLLEEAVLMGGAWLLQPKVICCGSIHPDKAGDTSCWVVCIGECNILHFFVCNISFPLILIKGYFDDNRNEIMFFCISLFMDRLYGLVVRVPGYRSRCVGSLPSATRFSEK